VVSEVDGIVSFGRIKRGNREIMVETKDGDIRKYMVNLSKHILVQEGDFVKAGMPLSDGAITPADILSIKGPFAVQEYIVNEIQEVYRLQGVRINDKHIEVIVRQMMRKMIVTDAGDTRFLEKSAVDKFEFIEENDQIYDKKYITEAGESETYRTGEIITVRQMREENSLLKRNDKKIMEFRDALASTAMPLLQGITKASLGTSSWISAASFQETTKVLSAASIAAREDTLDGLKENVIVGHRIPAGTGQRVFDDYIIGSRIEYERMLEEEAMRAQYTEEVPAPAEQEG
jgi:DNA-directed RNA polymerase subunit beta'